MKIEIIKTHKDGNRSRKKGQVLEVLPWKGNQLIKDELAKDTEVENVKK